MQEYIQQNMGEKLPYKEYSTMFTGSLEGLVAAFAKIQDDHFGFKPIKEFLESEGAKTLPYEKIKEVKF